MVVLRLDLPGKQLISEMAEAIWNSIPEERVPLAGLSMGGYLALEMYRQAPHRVSGLALLSTQSRGRE